MTTYAEQFNAQFDKKDSDYVNVNDRLDAEIGEGDEFKESLLESAKAKFRTANPHIKTWADIKLARPAITTMDKIAIDITLQRALNLMHSLGIVEVFNPTLVTPLSVYEDANLPGKYICWNGQHTSIALLVIAAHVLGEDPSNVQIPIMISPTGLKSEMRNGFITLATDGVKPLDEVDIFHQMIYGVRTDGSIKPAWELAEAKQEILEKHKMFVGHEKFGNDKMPGAFNRPSPELLNSNKYDLAITQDFCDYFVSVCKSNRPVQPKEVWLMYDFFKLCRKTQGVKVDKQFIASVAVAIKTAFGGDMNSLALNRKAKKSWEAHWLDKNPDDAELERISYNVTDQAMTFLLAILRKHLPKGTAIPKDPAPRWIPKDAP